MATGLQVRTSNQLISGGYPGEPVGVDGGWNNWTNTGLSGNVTATYYFYDSDYADNGRSSRIECEIRDSWTATIDQNTNRMSVTITTTITRLARTQVIGAPNRGFGRRYRAWNADRSSEAINVYSGDISQITTFATNVQVQQRVITVDPGAENTIGTVYFRGNTGGHDGDGTPSKYVDEMSFGISVRNTLPAPPPKPTLTLTSQSTEDCETVDAKIRINQGRVGDFSATNTYYRYKIGTGEYTAWELAGTSVGQMTVTLVALPAETSVSVQAYTRGDSTTSATSDTLTFTTMARPSKATLALSSQVAESDETTVAATIAFTQGGVSNFNTLVTYMRYRAGYRGEWSEWQVVGTNQSSGTFTLHNLPAGNVLTEVETYSTGNGICSSTVGLTTFRTLLAPDPPYIDFPAQTDTGTCVNASFPWEQVNTDLYTNGETFYSYRVADGNWSAWIKVPNWEQGTVSLSCLDYSTKVCIRMFSKGNGLRGTSTQKCFTTSNATVDDTPYSGAAFINTVLCNSMLYLVELICQEWYAIREGDMEVYTNEEHKAQCHGDEDDPTLHSILSRIYRFIGAMACLICSGLNDDLNYHKRGASGRYLQSQNETGDFGEWTPVDNTPTEDSTALVTSDGINSAVEEYIHAVYHYVGTWGYLTLNETTLGELTDVREGSTAIVKNGADGLNQEYVYDGTGWDAGDLQEFDNFSLIHVMNDSTWEYQDRSVTIKAGSGWYWYNNNWNQLDAVSDEEEAIIEELSELNFVQQQSESEEQIYFKTLSRNPDGTVTSPGVVDKRTVYFITEDANSVTVTFETCGGTEIPSQTVPFNGTATRPADPVLEGWVFTRWKMVVNRPTADQMQQTLIDNDIFTTPLTSDVTVCALWKLSTQYLSADPRRGQADWPGGGDSSRAQAVLYRHTQTSTAGNYNRALDQVPIPRSPSKYFAGWLLAEQEYTTTDEWTDVVDYVRDLEDLTPSDGDLVLVQYGANGLYQLYAYDATEDEWSAGDVLHWSMDYNLMPAHTVYLRALYRDKYTITFNSAGGTAVDTQYVSPTETVTEPTAPTRTMYRFDGWTADGVEPYDFDAMVTGDLTLTAMWTPYHTVTFDADGGTPAPAPQTVIDGGTATRPTDPEKEGYVFNGWIKEEE